MSLLAQIENITNRWIPPRSPSAAMLQSRRVAVSGEAAGESTVDLNLYWQLLRSHVRTISVFVMAAMLAAIVYLHMATPVYTVTLQVTPVEPNGSSSLQSGLSGFAGVASLAGLTLPGGPGQKQLDLYLAALDSPSTATSILRKKDIATVLFKSSWDPEHKVWREPPSLTRPVTDGLKSLLGFTVQPWHPPMPQDVMETVDKDVVVDHKPISPIVTITYKHPNPEFARQFLLALHSAADGELKTRAMQRATAYIAYLTSELEHVTSADHRQALINTLSDQEALRMAAGANISYSVDVFSAPTATSRPTSPQPKAILIGAALAGLLIGAVFVIVRYRPG